ncbi:MAG: chemotaxis protein CheX [Oligoflexia bacterium]|nr:chemotaxis protein CheX [Oligoflexia bacterium]
MTKVLLVDKFATGLTPVEQALDAAELRVVRTSSAREALLKLGKERFDLIISEIATSGASRIEVYKAFSSYVKASACPLVLFGGGPEDFQFLLEQELPRLHHLQKVLDPDTLAAAIKTVLAPRKNAALNVEFINPVLQATMTTITTMTELAVTPGKPYMKKHSDVSGDISGVVAVASEGFKGSISISFCKASFLRVASRILKTEFTEITDENRDAIAELINIIFGQARNLLSSKGHHFEPALPSIISDPGHSVDHRSEHPPIAIDFAMADAGNLRIEICVAS